MYDPREDEEKRRRRSEEARRAAEEAAKEKEKRKRPLPTLAAADETAQALERALRRGRVGGIEFSAAHALRGPRGWPIVARLARSADLLHLSRELLHEIVGEIAAAEATVVHTTATEMLRADIEAALRAAYPMVLTPLSPSKCPL
jgi:hypothetical protein